MICLTFDTDWVPPFVLSTIRERLDASGVPATFFCTSPYEFGKTSLHECALHPNLMDDSTQGNSESERLVHMLHMYPQAVGVRTHRLYWHGGLFSLYSQHGLQYDASVFYPLQQGLAPYKDMGLTRFPIWWADTFHIRSGFSLTHFSPPGFDCEGLKVLLFHPIHIYMNSHSTEDTRARLAPLRLPEVSTQELEPLRYSGKGMEHVFMDALRQLSARDDVVLLRDLL